jgi:uncharacterized membrane protein YfcA
MSPVLARGVSVIASTVIACLAVVMVLGHYLVTPAATALLGCAIGARLGASRVLHRREIAGRRW